ncbi:MAG: hypothetical protein AAGH76_08775 [Pseudomonadota bacterium]
MLPLDDNRWANYRTGYNFLSFDIQEFLLRLVRATANGRDWDVLWDELHHQGDVGELAYATIPYLVAYAEKAQTIEWHAFGFPAVVEIARLTIRKNPSVPMELEPDYSESFKKLADIALRRGESAWGEHCFEPIMSCLALAYNRPKHAELYLDATESEITDFFKYRDKN